jgi:undecaprenol kinase
MLTFKKQLRRLRFAMSGIRYAVQHDKSFRTQWYIGGGITAAILYSLSPLSATEVLLLIGAFILILITELQNSALEAALDHLHPELHDTIGKSKDMAAGAVLLAGLFMLAVVISLVYIRL